MPASPAPHLEPFVVLRKLLLLLLAPHRACAARRRWGSVPKAFGRLLARRAAGSVLGHASDSPASRLRSKVPLRSQVSPPKIMSMTGQVMAAAIRGRSVCKGWVGGWVGWWVSCERQGGRSGVWEAPAYPSAPLAAPPKACWGRPRPLPRPDLVLDTDRYAERDAACGGWGVGLPRRTGVIRGAAPVGGVGGSPLAGRGRAGCRACVACPGEGPTSHPPGPRLVRRTTCSAPGRRPACPSARGRGSPGNRGGGSPARPALGVQRGRRGWAGRSTAGPSAAAPLRYGGQMG